VSQLIVLLIILFFVVRKVSSTRWLIVTVASGALIVPALWVYLPYVLGQETTLPEGAFGHFVFLALLDIIIGPIFAGIIRQAGRKDPHEIDQDHRRLF
jgi:membrane protein DedA with SNARE-associated domain